MTNTPSRPPGLCLQVATNYVLGPFLFTLFIFLVFFVVLSMFLSIVDESYDVVRTQLDERKEQGAVEPLERDLARFYHEVCLCRHPPTLATRPALDALGP